VAGTTPPNAAAGGFRLLVAVTALVTFALIILGGVVRVTGSGLGCPDWPLCHGQIIPPFEYHTLIEYSHRMVASLVSLLVVATTVAAWIRYRRNRRIVVPVTLALVALGVEVVLGGITVLTELPPTIVTVHLLVAQMILGLLVFTLFATGGATWAAGPSSDRFFRWALGAAVFTLGVTLSGSYLVGVGATAVCPDWPLCDGNGLPSTGLTWVHMAHRLMAAVGVVIVARAAWMGWDRRRLSRSMGAASVAVAALTVAQVLAGAANPWFQFVPAAQAVHLGLATALWGSLVLLTALASRPLLIPVAGAALTVEEFVSGRPWGAILKDYVTLTKPTIMSLLLLTAAGGMALAAQGAPPMRVVLAVLIGGGLASGGASAVNHFMDRDIDRLMRRTASRPVASERVPARHAAVFGLVLTVLAFVVLWWGANLLAAALAMTGTALYLLVYTKWLKRATAQNIVIGGAAGAIPPMVGWAAVTGSLALPPLLLFGIIFLWTPPHFWALALLLHRDYAAAGVPMLPVVKGEASTRWAILRYTLPLVALTVLLYPVAEVLGLLYLAAALVLGAGFIGAAALLLRRADRKAALQTYLYSLLYLALLFLVIIVDSAVF
jgi:protoheme IX farnesyltransferase